MSYRTLNSHPLNASVKTLLKRGAHIGLGIGAFTPVLALANPTGGQVVAGQANITAQNANNLVIHQGTQSAIIDWQQFSIGSGQYVQFLQPSSSSVVLNRVVGGSPTSILGNLSANGQVFLVNSNGVYFAKGASIDAQGFLASTLDIRNSDFLNHNYSFGTPGANGATIVNEGSITAHKGGYVVLAGDYAQNTGIITAQSGHVILAAGSKATLNLSGNQLVNFAVNQATLASYVGVNNSGSLIADGGTVVMTADVANALKATVVNNSGLVEAKSMSAAGGHIYLTATGGNILNSGTINASAGKVGAKGGDIVLKGDGRTTLTDASKISATGQAADGGHLELSGNTLSVRGTTSLGKGGKLLIDPNSVELVSGSSAGGVGQGTGTGSNINVGVGFIEQQLDAGADVSISAHNRIFHSNGADITTTNAAGDLTLKVAAGGQIQLAGISINLAGNFTASVVGTGHGVMSIGSLQAASIALHDQGGLINFAPAQHSGGGAITVYSARATTGNLLVDAGKMHGLSGDFALKAKGTLTDNAGMGTFFTTADSHGADLEGKTVITTASLYASGKVSIIAGKGGVHIGGNIGGDSILITAASGGIAAGTTSINGGTLTLSAAKGDVHVGDLHATQGVHVSAASGGIEAGIIHAGDEASITAIGGDITLGRIEAGGNLTIKDAGHILSFDGSNTSAGATVVAEGNVSLTAGTIQQSHAHDGFKISAGGNITVKGKIALASYSSIVSVSPSGPVPVQVPHDLTLTAGGAIKLDHGIKVPGNLFITADQLLYTGKGKTFSLSAGFGDLVLGASIGSAEAGVKYNVKLATKSDQVDVTRSIYTGTTAGGLAANLTLLETSHAAGSTAHGAVIGDAAGGNVTLSTKGTLTITGQDVVIGNTSGNSSLHFGAITLKSGKDMLISAASTGPSHHGYIHVAAQAINAYGGNADTAVLLQAGGNLSLKADKEIDVFGASGDDLMSVGDSGTAKVDTSVTLKAKGNLTLDAGEAVDVEGGTAIATAQGSSGKIRNVTVDASLNLTAGKALTIHGASVTVDAGYGMARASAGEGAQNRATAIADANLKAGTTLDISATGVVLVKAGPAGFNGSADAVGGAKASANAHGDVTLKAQGMSLHAGGNLELMAGNGVGARSSTGTMARASEAGAEAGFIATGDIAITAGTGGITLQGGNVSLSGGNSVARWAGVSAVLSGAASFDAEARIDLVTTGGLSITAPGTITVQGGGLVGADVLAIGDGGTAKITADGGVGIRGASISMTAAGSDLSITGGSLAGSAARAHAASGGQASVEVGGGVTLAATGGNITLKGKRDVTLTGGSGVAVAHSENFRNILSFISATGTGSSTVNHYHASSGAHVFQAEAVAQDLGSKADLSADAGVSLSASGNLSVSQTGSISGSLLVQGGAGAGHDAHVDAGNGASAALHAGAGVNLSAGNKVNLSGRAVTIRGGDAAAAMSLASSLRIGTLTQAASTTGTFAATNSFAIGVAGVKGHGLGAQAGLIASATVGVTGAAISVTSKTAGIQIQGGNAAAEGATLTGASSGYAMLQASDGVDFTATGAVSLKSGQEMDLGGGSYGGHIAAVFGKQSGVAGLGIDSVVSLSGGTVSLTAGGELKLETSRRIGASMHASGQSSGRAGALVAAGVDITAKTAFTAAVTGSGDLKIVGNSSAGFSASVNANATHAGAQLEIDDGIGIRVTATGGTIALDAAATNIVVQTGADTGKGVNMSAVDSGSAHLDLKTGIDFSAKGAVSMTARQGSVFLGGGAGLGSGAVVTANSYGGADLHITDGVSVMGGSVNLSAGGNITVKAGQNSNGNHASASAQAGGVASYEIDEQASIQAKHGALTLKANGELRVYGASGSNAVSATAKASHTGAKATFILDQGASLNGATAVTLKSGQFMDIEGVTGNPTAQNAQVIAGMSGSAAMRQDEGVTITTRGTFTASGHARMSMQGAIGLGQGAQVTADGSQATALYSGSGGLHIAAGKIRLLASDMFITGGDRAGALTQVSAKNGGSATLAVAAGLDMTAVSGISASITDASKQIYIFSGHQTGEHASASASDAASKAQVTADASAHITVTGAAGSIKINTGNLSGTFIYLGASTSAGLGVIAKAKQGGSAAVDVTNNFEMSALGAISVINPHGSASITAGYAKNGGSMSVTATSGGKAAADVASGIDITGGSLTVQTGTLYVQGARGENADDVGVHATAGGSAQASVDMHVNLTAATGALKLSATGNAFIEGMVGGASAAHGNGSSASITATGPGAAASLTVSGHVLLSGKTAVTLKAGDTLKIGGNTNSGSLGTPGMDGGHGKLTASSSGTAELLEDAGITITTHGTFTAKGHDVLLRGASSLGGHLTVTGSSDGFASASFQGSLSVTAKRIAVSGADVTLAGGSNLVSSARIHMQSANAFVQADAGVVLHATGGNLSVTATHVLTVKGGNRAGAGNAVPSGGGGTPHSFNTSGSLYSRSSTQFRTVDVATVQAKGATANATLGASAGVTLIASGALALSQTGGSGSVVVAGGDQAANQTRALASSGASTQVSADAGVNLSAGMGLTLSGFEVKVHGGGDAAQGGPSSFTSTNINHCTTASGCGSPFSTTKTTVATVNAQGGATAGLTAHVGVSLGAASVTLAARNTLVIRAGSGAGRSASLQAHGSNDAAVDTVHTGVAIDATGAIALTAVGQITLAAGSSAGVHAVVTAGSDAGAGLQLDGALAIQAGTSFTATAPIVRVSGGNDAGASAQVTAQGAGAQATATVAGGVGITAKTITVTGTLASSSSLGLLVAGGAGAAVGAHVHASDGGAADLTADTGISLSATGKVSLKAIASNLRIQGGGSSLVSGDPTQSLVFASASGSGAVASLEQSDGVLIHAGNSLTVKAGQDLSVAGGFGNHASIQGQSGGSAKASLDAAVSLSAGHGATLTAVIGSVRITGGDSDAILANVFPSNGSTASPATGPVGGKLTGTLDASVSVTAGTNLTIKAGTDVVVSAGGAATLQVGALKTGASTYQGLAWGGGSADLTGAVGVVLSAGSLLTADAGTGSLTLTGKGLGLDSASHLTRVAIKGATGATLNLDGSVSITGTTLDLNGGVSINHSGSTVSGVITVDGGIFITGTPVTAFSPLTAPPLGTLQSQALVMHLETLLAPVQPGRGEDTLFDPSSQGSYLGAFGGACKAELTRATGGSYRCGSGGK